MAEIVKLPASGLQMFERSLRKFLAEKTAREQAAAQSVQDTERLAFALGSPINTAEVFTLDLQTIGTRPD